MQKDIYDIDDIDAAIEMHEDRNENAVEIVKDRCNAVIHNGDGRKLVDKSAQLSRCRVATNPDELSLKRKRAPPDRLKLTGDHTKILILSNMVMTYVDIIQSNYVREC